MSGASSSGGSSGTTKLQSSSQRSDDQSFKDAQKPTAALEEDDEFEDFPVEDWPQEEAGVPGANQHLWEESWDDDDTNEDFSKQLKEELDKVKANK